MSAPGGVICMRGWGMRVMVRGCICSQGWRGGVSGGAGWVCTQRRGECAAGWVRRVDLLPGVGMGGGGVSVGRVDLHPGMGRVRVGVGGEGGSAARDGVHALAGRSLAMRVYLPPHPGTGVAIMRVLARRVYLHPGMGRVLAGGGCWRRGCIYTQGCCVCGWVLVGACICAQGCCVAVGCG